MTASKKVSLFMAVALVIFSLFATDAMAQKGKVTQIGNVTALTLPEYELNQALDYKNAKPMPLPMADVEPPLPFSEATIVEHEGLPQFEPGNPGNGKPGPGLAPKNIFSKADEEFCEDAEVAPDEYGTSNHPFTTMRVDVSSNNNSKYFPYRAAGKLYFKIGTSSYICSASLIKRGLAVTAAHCVAEFGKQKFFSNWQYVPAMYGSVKPYGTWNVTKAYVMTSYYKGTEVCYQTGVICPNDIAVLVITPQSTVYPGTRTGWFGYGVNGYGFTPQNNALINQLGYPASHDSGLRMQRTDSQGFVSATFSGNTIWGSRQTGGSSGGPELVNLGIRAALSGGVTVGSEANANTVVGVTSWGYTNQAVKQQGASPFKTTNIGTLVNTACTAYPNACN